MKAKGHISLETPVVIILVLLLPSCYSYKNIHRNEPITRELLSSLYVGSTYVFDLKVGQPVFVQITDVKADTIVGLMHRQYDDEVNNYSESFETIERNVVRISLRRRDTTLTIFAIAISATLTLGVILHSTFFMLDSMWQ